MKSRKKMVKTCKKAFYVLTLLAGSEENSVRKGSPWDSRFCNGDPDMSDILHCTHTYVIQLIGAFFHFCAVTLKGVLKQGLFS